MFVEELERHLAVSSITELEGSLKMDAGFWNVVSIREPAAPRPAFLRCARGTHEAILEGPEGVDPNLRFRLGGNIPRPPSALLICILANPSWCIVWPVYPRVRLWLWRWSFVAYWRTSLNSIGSRSC